MEHLDQKPENCGLVRDMSGSVWKQIFRMVSRCREVGMLMAMGRWFVQGGALALDLGHDRGQRGSRPSGAVMAGGGRAGAGGRPPQRGSGMAGWRSGTLVCAEAD